MNLKKIKRIALVRNSHMGDLVCSLPAFEALRQGLPQAHITAIANDVSAPLLDHHPDVDEVLLDDENDPPEHLTALLRAGKFDAVLVAFCSRRNSWAALRAGVPIRVTHGRRWFQALCGTHRTYQSRKKPPYHEAAFILSFVQRLGIPFTLADARPQLHVDPAERAKIEDRVVAALGFEGPIFAVHPGSRGSAFNWPIENYFQLIERLSTVGRVLLTGNHFDRQRLDWIESRLTPALRGRVLPLTDLPLPEMIACLSLVDCYVSSSTGTLHLAAIVSRSALGLYSEAPMLHPRRWGPIGPRATVLTAPWTYAEPPFIRSPLGEPHMAQITVDTVVERMVRMVSLPCAA